MDGTKVAGLFNSIASRYDFLNHFLSLGLDIYWRHRLARLLPLQHSSVYIDVAAGTMDLSLAVYKHLSEYEPRIIACDFSWNMLLLGKKKISSPNLVPVLGDGRNLPLSAQCADVLTIAFGLRNISDRNSFYAEALRVLKPGGKLYILEFGGAKKAIWKGLYNFYLRWVLPVIGRLVSRDPSAYRYLADSVQEFPQAEELAAEVHQAGFYRQGYFSLTGGIVWIHVATKPVSSNVCPDTQGADQKE